MKPFRHIATNELQMLLRNPFQLVALFLFGLLGLYSIYYGHTEIGRQTERILQVEDSVRTAQSSYRNFVQADTTTSEGKENYDRAASPSLIRFRYNFLVANKPSPLAELSIGQRDLYPYYFILNAQNLYTQTLKGEIYNPFKLSAGNFDLSFVLIYLLPLLITGLCFDALSFERDIGTFDMLRTGHISIRSIFVYRLLFRYVLIGSAATVLSAIGFLVSGIDSGLYMFLWLLVLWLYSALWFAIILFISSFNRSSSFNATAAVGAWILLLMAIPSMLNLYGLKSKETNAFPLASLMRSRTMPETDSAMNAALRTFYIYHPELKPQNRERRSPFFYYQGYSAFLAIDQAESAKKIDEFYRLVEVSEAKRGLLNFVNPAVATQEILNGLASTNLKAELDFKTAVKNFYDRIFWFSNRVLFEDRLMTAEDYDQSPQFMFTPNGLSGKNLAIGLVQLVLLALILATSGYRNLNDKNLTNERSGG
ncbi:ABC transporter permease subunit [Marinilongibacter aquaticus]|uniref:DUF3526 domain-containing protein n=1 Tax=Marinilongibacter aquaticus TaxID=2975157 RepID=UPI0021BD1C72|nr:DUF3526 domain-containing protein [Marinilongibacter aquaticus]UBM58611.1 ABC transporter permease subunit [Marinilongibacter aquaticus]